jgi:putative FmdB family regulatory protein
MPLYDMKCGSCEHEEEIFSQKSLTENDSLECPKCKEEKFKKIWTTGFIPDVGREAFSFGQRVWTKGLSPDQQAAKAYEHAFGKA